MQRFSDLFENFPVKLLAVACFSAVTSMADRVLRHSIHKSPCSVPEYMETHFLRDMDTLYPVLYPMRRYHSPPPFLSSSPSIPPPEDLSHLSHLSHLSRLSNLSNLSHLTRSVDKLMDGTEKKWYSGKIEKKTEKLETHKVMQTGIDIMMDQLLSIRRVRGGPD